MCLRKTLWSELLILRQSTTVMWMVIGDFNVVLRAHESSGGGTPNRSSCEDFRSVIELCNFQHLDTSGAFFTWSRGLGPRPIERRLDRSLCDETWFNSWPYTSCIAFPRVVSDHNCLLFSAHKAVSTGPRPFRFQSMWCLHPSFMNLVENCWSGLTPIGCLMYVTLQKLKALKLCLKHWNLSVFGNVHKNLEDACSKLSDIQLAIASSGDSESLIEEVVAKDVVLEASHKQESFWKDRARVKWLTEGDKCTAFFHAYARNKSARTRINYLQDGEALLTDSQDIVDHVVNFYQSLYSADTTSSGIKDICASIPSLVSREESSMLVSTPTPEEIHDAVFSMDPSSSPGLDGFPGYFYQKCWSIIGQDVVAFVQYFFQNNWLLPNVNSNFIVLISKVEDAIQVSQFRPIALANFLFKIIPKILATRLGPIASRIISPQQTVFLNGHRITESIGMSQKALIDCAKQILEIPLPNTPESDILIWENSSSGLFSFSDGYELVRLHFEKSDWASSVWRSFIPPRYSVLAWRIFHLKLPTDDQLQRRGIPIVSVKLFLRNLKIFGLSVVSLFLWLSGSLITSFGLIISNPLLYSKVLSSMGVIPIVKHRNAPRIVLWHPPLIPWLKLNTVGFFKGNLGLDGCGEVFRDSFGVEFAFHFGWHHIWLESDSIAILQCISSSSFVPPWPLRIAWHNCLTRIQHISFTCSHILRKGNSVADRFANLGLASSSLHWHATPPPENEEQGCAECWPSVTGLALRPPHLAHAALPCQGASLINRDNDWFRPALGSSGDRLQTPTSLCRDGLVPSSALSPRPATSSPNSTGSACLNSKGTARMPLHSLILERNPAYPCSLTTSVAHNDTPKTGRDTRQSRDDHHAHIKSLQQAQMCRQCPYHVVLLVSSQWPTSRPSKPTVTSAPHYITTCLPYFSSLPDKTAL
ncbi:hypothetical protein ACLB2K_008024 [Fragaria x ananassa]